MGRYYVTVNANGDTRWYKDAKCTVLHRLNGPAVELAGGTKMWFVNGAQHRTDGPASIWADGTELWHVCGEFHRLDGPAIIHPWGTNIWCANGKTHRTDGPAVEWADGRKEWFLNGEKLTEEEHRRRIQTAVELTVAEIERRLGHRVRMVE